MDRIGTRDGVDRRALLRLGALAASGSVCATVGTASTTGGVRSNSLSIGYARSEWPELGDGYACRVSESLATDVRIQPGDGLELTNPDAGTTATYGVAATHELDEGSTVRMGRAARDRIGVEPGQELAAPDWQPVDDPAFLERALSEWPEIGDAEAARVPTSDASLEGDYIDVTTVETDLERVYSVMDTHDLDAPVDTVRMGANARERLADPAVGTSVTYEPSASIAAATVHDAGFDNEFGISLASALVDRLGLQVGESVIKIERPDAGSGTGFGIVSQHADPGGDASVRIPSAGRSRLGDVAVGDTCSIEPLQDSWPSVDVAFDDWDAVRDNALLCGIDERIAETRGLSAGDMVTIRDRDSGRERVFRVARVYTEPDAGVRGVVRMGVWGRVRFANGVEDVDPADVVGTDVAVEPFDPPAAHTYVGVKTSPWYDKYTAGGERIFVHASLVDDLGLRAKFDGVPAGDPFDPAEANVDAGWDNLRIHHADHPDDRYGAYTVYGVHEAAESVPTIRMSKAARERLNDPDADAAVDDVPQSFVVRLDTDTGSQVPNPDFASPDGLAEPERGSADYELPHPNVYHPRVYDAEDSVEWYRDDPAKRLLVLAPHGGDVEWRTSRLCYYVAHELESAYWIHEGFRMDPASSFDRWHTTSADMRDGYPAIDALGFQWDYALSFHGFTEPDPLVGGRLERDLRETFATEYLAPTLPSETIQVYGSDHPPWAEAFAGTNPRNITNECTTDGALGGHGGVQLELPSSARVGGDDHWIDVADAAVAFCEEVLLSE